MSRSSRWSLSWALLCWAVSCGEPSKTEPGAEGSGGGVVAGGGGAPTGGVASRGGTSAVSGGRSTTGGSAPANGGASASSGAPAVGGVSATGGATTGGNPSVTTGGTGSGGTGGISSGGTGGASAAGNPATGGAPSGGRAPVTVFLAGDSTVSTYRDTASTTDQAGWGQMFRALFDDSVRVENRAVGGMTARHFIENGYLSKIFEDAKSGDYLLVQFGTNDGNRNATYMLDGKTIPYFLDPATDFKDYVKRYIDGARERGVTPVLVTPPPRNSAYCTGGNGTGAHAAALRELGSAENTPVADLNQKSVDYLKAICPAPTPEDFFFLRADGSVDGTHFQENGARKLAELVAEGLREAGVPLAERLR